MAYLVSLETFHGPLDLLLYLIEKNEVDIYDIPIAAITDQYLLYLNDTGDFDLDRLADFLMMASYLLNLKSRLLLPVGFTGDQEEEEVDPREELVRKLMEYRKFKQAAEYLLSRQEGEEERVFFRQAQEELPVREEIAADMKTLIRAYNAVLRDKAISGSLFEPPHGDVRVEEKIEEIIERLEAGSGELVFQDLFAGVINRREALALFLALLELLRLQKVRAVQDVVWGEIRIIWRVAMNNVDAG